MKRKDMMVQMRKYKLTEEAQKKAWEMFTERYATDIVRMEKTPDEWNKIGIALEDLKGYTHEGYYGKSKEADCEKMPNTDKPINKVTVSLLDVALRFAGISIDKDVIDKIIDLVELIEDHGEDTNLMHLCKLQADWDRPQPADLWDEIEDNN
tara:strand:+ start:42757 stop:43212 length:456 start_codon:yes stop_codon:yes gene_type:complete